MRNRVTGVGSIAAKLAAGVLVLLLVALGIVGLVVPIIPGLLFLAIAAVIGAKLSPTFARWAKSNGTTRDYLDHADRISDLGFADQLRVGALLCIKALITGLAATVAAVSRLMTGSTSRRALARVGTRDRLDRRY